MIVNTLMSAAIASDGFSLNAGAPAPLFQTRMASTGAGQAGRQYDVAPDGRFLINVLREDQFSSPITVVLNWVARL